MCPEGAEAGDDVMACGSRERQLFVVATNKTVKGEGPLDLPARRRGETPRSRKGEAVSVLVNRSFFSIQKDSPMTQGEGLFKLLHQGYRILQCYP